MGKSMEARRAWTGAALFSLGLRPFFLGGALFAALAIPAWILGFVYGQPAVGALSAPEWHAHEMIFGFVGAIIAGFLLTAVPNWTGRLPVAGPPLIGLTLIWAAGRVAAAAPLPFVLAVAVDLLFPTAIAALTAREVLAGGNKRNLPVVALAALFAIGDGVFWAARMGADGLYGLGERIGLAAVALLIVLIGGRVVPSFTRNWLAQRGETRFPREFGAVDKAAMLLAAIGWAAWAAAPDSRVVGGVMLLAAAAQAVRLSGWRGGATFGEPLVLVLHASYGWLTLAMALIGVAAIAPQVWPPTAALHAFAAGAAPMMSLAMMTRASRGHTGRSLTADRATVAMYIAVSLGAALRTLGPAVSDNGLWTAAIGGGIWAAGMLGFVVVYGPMLLRPRA